MASESRPQRLKLAAVCHDVAVPHALAAYKAAWHNAAILMDMNILPYI